jgi:hypothetical protein
LTVKAIGVVSEIKQVFAYFRVHGEKVMIKQALVWVLGAIFGTTVSVATGPVAAEAATPASKSDIKDVAADLRFLREEEKLARDIYVALHERWGIVAFDTISAAEQRHMNRVMGGMESRGIPDPVVKDTVGVFANPELAKLFQTLTKRGDASEAAALRVGVLVEELDIHDIQGMRTRTQDREVLSTYDLLECGSRNHLRTFVRNLSRRNATYAPVHLKQAAFDAIVAGEHERCGHKYGGARQQDGGRGPAGGGRGKGSH